MKTTQCLEILKYTDNHEWISPKEALLHLGCMRLAARISDLEKAGYVFEHKMIYTTDEDGKPQHYMSYKKVS